MQRPVRLVTLAPGHFHAALVQKEMLSGVDSEVHVFAPDDADLAAHLARIEQFNSRAGQPTSWQTHVHAGPDWLERFRSERPGNVAVIAGRNRPKIDLIQAAVEAGYFVLADKPWIVDANDFPKLERVLETARRNGVFVRDIMTERWEATTRVQRELMRDPEVFGEPLAGTADEPGLVFGSRHYLKKQVTGVRLRRPAWWFDPATAGESLADVGTHLVDLSIWLGFPGEAIDYRRDIKILDAEHWPTILGREQFAEVTGLTDFPSELSAVREGERLDYWGNGRVHYRLNDRFVRVSTFWEYEAPAGEGDGHLARVDGSRSSILIVHVGGQPEVYVMPQQERDQSRILAVIRSRYPAYETVELLDRIHLSVPAAERTGHESHFASVLREFIGDFHDRSRIPLWEEPNMLAKYFITTQAIQTATNQSRARSAAE